MQEQSSDSKDMSHASKPICARPMSITVISWIFIVLGAFSLMSILLAATSPKYDEILANNLLPVALQKVFAIVASLVILLAGFFMLRGATWPKWLYLVWGPIGVLFSTANVGSTWMLIPSLVIYLAIVAVLFPRAKLLTFCMGLGVMVLAVTVYLFGAQVLGSAVSTAASKALKVNVGVGKVSVARGRVGISDLEVDNPEGYSTKTLLTLGSAGVKAQMGSLLSDTVMIDEIKLDSIELTIEQKGLSTNLKDLLDNIAAGKPTSEKTPEEKKEGGKNLKIKTLEISNVTVKVKVLGGPEIPLKLDTIRMENLGSDEPVDVAMLTGKILAAIAAGVAKQGAGIIPSDITGGLQSGLSNIGKVGGELLESGKGILEKGKDAGTGVGDTLKGIFQKKE